MVEIAARRPLARRGYLEDSDGPMGPEDLAAASGLRRESFELAIKVLSEKGIEWLVLEESSSALPEQPAALENFGLQDRTRQNKTKHTGDFPVDCDRFIREYPKEVSDWEIQILLSEVRAQADQDLLFQNLGLYQETDQWKDGYIPSAENWLKKGAWKVAPKRNGAVRAGKTGLDDTLEWLSKRGEV